MLHRIASRFFLPVIVVWLMAGTVVAQLDPNDFQLIPELSQFNAAGPSHDLVVDARLRIAPDGKVGLLQVTAKMNNSWHVYSLTQPPGGPMKSVIHLAPSEDYRLLGSFAPDRPPNEHYVDVFEMNAEEFPGEVTWAVPIAFADGKSAQQIEITGYVEGQVCADGGACVPFGEKETRFTAKLGNALSSEQAKSLTGFRLSGTHGLIRGWLSANAVQPGGTVQLHISINPDPDWHVYAYEKLPPSMFQKPTLIQANVPGVWVAGKVKSAAPIISEESPLPNDPPIRYYDGPATLSLPIQVPKTAKPGNYPLSGHVAYQTCAKQCDRPTAVAWQAQLKVVAADSSQAAIGSVSFDAQPVDYDAVVKLLESTGPAAVTSGSQISESAESGVVVASIDDLQVEGEDAPQRSLVAILGFAFLGGFILNFMPCVLPVIGLKIMSFVDQAGASRIRVFGLNAWYALGMLSIFWLLAVLAAAPALGLSEDGFGWGQQFNYQVFTIPLVCLIFAMALSFLGVWEIPIPGFAMGNKASELTEKEGYSGAFFKGGITTILATPCSAPGLATAYGWAVQSRSAGLAFLVFTVMGLGMAAPYLVIGAFPSLIRFLPRPGAWMDTFKQLMGFVLLGTVIFLMQNVAWQFLLPTLTMLFGLWFACWWVGRVPMTADPEQRLRAWAIAIAIGLVAATLSFGRHVDAFGRSFRGIRGWSEQKFNLEIDRLVGERSTTGAAVVQAAPESENALPWEPFSQELLDELRSSQTTVLVDFTADW